MEQQKSLKATNIIGSFRILKGNTLISVIFEPLWGIPFMIYNFYLSLYMKELGVTDVQLGYLISIGFIFGTVLSLFAGIIIDRLGRKRATLIFDFISWPVAVLIYAISNSFLLFVVATLTNAFWRIVAVSGSMMLLEDSDGTQRLAAFNLLNIINIGTGVIIPIAGIVVSSYGVVHAERIFLLFAAISMSAMILLRNHFYKETQVGLRILEEHRKNPVKNSLKTLLPFKAAGALRYNPTAIMTVYVFILFNIYIPLGAFNSLYFAPYMTEVLMLDKPTISVLGGVYSAMMFIVFVFIIPAISRFNKYFNMIAGLGIQALALYFLIVIPAKNLTVAILCITLYALGFGIFRPFIDTLLAEVTEGRERAGMYSIVNTATCIATALIAFVSGNLYVFNPRLLYVISIAILLICGMILVIFLKSIKVNMKIYQQLKGEL